MISAQLKLDRLRDGDQLRSELSAACESKSPLGWSNAALNSLLDMAERSTRGSSPTVELNVHKDNPDAQSYYKHIGFSDFGEVSGGLAILMRRKR